ncbi:MAG: hypothetical protein Q8M15_09570 [Bacteroidota bacterium]|nr:hypothetical protein [Bacteroidota bacterium]
MISNNKLTSLLFVLILMVFTACKTNINTNWMNPEHAIPKSKTHRFIFFTLSNNSINSRIAQDELVRLSSCPSMQSYLFLKGEPINEANRTLIQQKLLQNGYDYALILYLSDSTDSYETNTEKNFYTDYRLHIEPYMYNPVYAWHKNKFKIKAQVYFIADEKLVWSDTSTEYNADHLEHSVKEYLKLMINKLKQRGFMNDI